MLRFLFSIAFLTGCTFFLSAQTDDLTTNTSSIDFGDLYENERDSFRVVVYNSTPRSYSVTDIDVLGLFGHHPYSYNDSDFVVPAMDSASFWLYAQIRHNIINNSVLVIKTNSNSGALLIDLNAQGKYSNTYYNATENLSEEQLKTAFSTLLSSGYNTLSYNAARDEMFMEIDNQAANGQGASTNTLECVYTGTVITNFSNRSQAQNMGFNTEHTFPQGQFNSNNPMRTDLHHLFPTTSTSNSTRSNHRFGIVVNQTWTQGGSKLGSDASGNTVFEPRDVHKGVAARAMLYFVIRYQNYNGYLNIQEGVLKSWSEQYPPNAVEQQRNDDVFSVQGNRNPFIDYPQFVDRITNFSSSSAPPSNPGLEISEMVVNIVDDASTGDTVEYGIVFTNPETFTTSLSNVQISGNGFSLVNYQGGNINIQPNEGFRLIIRSTEPFESGTLSFQTNILGMGTVNIPIVRESIGVEESERLEVKIFPNPATGRVNVQNLRGEYMLLTVDGRKVRSGISHDDFQIAIDGLSSGVYLLKHSGGVERLIIR